MTFTSLRTHKGSTLTLATLAILAACGGTSTSDPTGRSSEAVSPATTESQCLEEAACPFGTECVGGSCIACLEACTIDCLPGTSCITDGQQCATCVPTSCKTEKDCPDYTTCIDHKCIKCLSNCAEIFCPPGLEYCAGDPNGCDQCVLFPGKCLQNSDCPPGDLCVNNSCIPVKSGG
jgi:hypothetical protein